MRAGARRLGSRAGAPVTARVGRVTREAVEPDPVVAHHLRRMIGVALARLERADDVGEIAHGLSVGRVPATCPVDERHQTAAAAAGLADARERMNTT
jgi:hypothetical protein